MIANHVLIREGVGLTFHIQSWEVENFYHAIRDASEYAKKGEMHPWGRSNTTWIHGAYNFGVTTIYGGEKPRKVPTICYSTHSRKPTYGFVNEIDITMGMSYPDGFTDKVVFHYQVSWAIVKKEMRPNGYGGERLGIVIEFYNQFDELVITMEQDEPREFRCKAGKYVMDVDKVVQTVQRKKSEFDGGCLYCKEAEYKKGEDGFIYLYCPKYNGQVKEVEYTGEEYPSYCKRRK